MTTTDTIAAIATPYGKSAIGIIRFSGINIHKIIDKFIGHELQPRFATNTKIIKSSSAIGSAATTLDQFTKTDYQSVKYYILTKDDTATEYQISEMNLVHNGTTCYFTDYAKVSSTSGFSHTFTATISGATVTLSALSSSNTTATALLYRVGLGSKTKLGTYDNVFYNVIGDVDSTVETIDSFDVFKYKNHAPVSRERCVGIS